MVESIIEYSARNRFIVFLLVFAFSAAGLWAMWQTPIDALPDISDTQVIVYTTWPGRSPDLIEDQITYPIVTALLSAPKVTVVRGFSDFGYSYVYILFKDNTDIYWARSRVLERLNQLSGRMPDGVTPQLGPDATGVGWVLQYALIDETGQHDLAALRSFQDWYLRYWLRAVEGVAEVASVGGFVRQYQINLDPTKVSAYRLSLPSIIETIRESNNDVGGRVVEFSGIEYVVRGRGYIKKTDDIEKIAVGVNENGTPILLRDVATVRLGPDMRRGLVELNGQGEVAGGIVIMRFGENAINVIERVKAKLKETEPSLPKGVKVLTVYDRSDLIHESIATASESLLEELIVTGVLIIAFLLHVRSAIGVHSHVPDGDRHQHHVARRHHRGHRRHGGCGHRDRGQRAQAIGGVGARRASGRAASHLDRFRQGSRPADICVGPCHRHFVHPDLCPRSPGRPDVQAAGLDEQPRHRRVRGVGHHAGPGLSADLHSRQDLS